MNLLTRGCFILLIAAGVWIQAVQIKRIGEAEPATTTVPKAAARMGLTTVDRTQASLLVFASPECPDRIGIQFLKLDGRSADGPLGFLAPSGYERYIFLGSVQDHLDIFLLRGRWLVANALFVIGLRSNKPGGEIVHVMLPASCARLAGTDWTQLSPW
jgi:hypothetical protein